MSFAEHATERNPTWYKEAIIYQVHVRAYSDSDRDGTGDFLGLTSKLDYIQNLGVTAIWLLPFYPSPLRDDGYDIADYNNVNPMYGQLADFKQFLKEAHRRGLRVITEMVLNHTSDQHAWFQRARRAPAGSKLRDFYVWSDDPEKYRDTRIIFKDFEASNWTWDPVADAYYWHRFYSHQPDLNFDNIEVHKAVFQAIDFWLKMGVDGLRLDAVPYLYEREGTSCENLKETHEFLKLLRKHVDEKFADRMLLAEANQWPEDSVEYFGEGDECHMAFHFPLMPRLFMAVHREDRYPIIDILQQTPEIPQSCQWTLFLRNHDELTLEMVTDEERDYMNRVYAADPRARINLGIRRRLAPLLSNNRRKIELLNGLLFSLPGTPVVYYGDEIGIGDNIYLGDRDSVRTPMQWSADRNAGFSHANPQQLFLPIITDPEYHFTAVNVETSQNNPHSLLWWMKRLIALRKRHRVFSRGDLEFLTPENGRVLAFVRRYEDETLLVVANLSRFVQYLELDLSEFRGMVPTELFGQTRFPPIGELPYFLTMGPHGFYWFLLKGAETTLEVSSRKDLPSARVNGNWEEVFEGRGKTTLEHQLPAFLQKQRWFGGKARTIQGVQVNQIIETGANGAEPRMQLVLVRVAFVEGEPDTYLLPLAFTTGTEADRLWNDVPNSVLMNLQTPAGSGIIHDATTEKHCWATLFELMARRKRLKSGEGELIATQGRAFRRLLGGIDVQLDPALSRAEQSNSSATFGDRFIFKLFRRIDQGVNPDLELSKFLSEGVNFPHIPVFGGALEYQQGKSEPITFGILHELKTNAGQAWEHTLDELGRYFDRVISEQDTKTRTAMRIPNVSLVELSQTEPPELAANLCAESLVAADLLGIRTAEMHLALASNTEDPSFAPEPFTPFYQRSLFQSMRNLSRNVFQLLKKQIKKLPDVLRDDAEKLLGLDAVVLKRFQDVMNQKVSAMRLRTHGDYHLGQVLYTGKDFVIIDFEGEPTRSITERRIKRSPLRDVAGMLRSFHYAAHAGLVGDMPGVIVRDQDFSELKPWSRFWFSWNSATFLRSYFSVTSGCDFLPKSKEELDGLLEVYMLEKALYELNYELNNRPDWVGIPLRGILDLVELEA